jgi:hypothetical protein
VAAVLMGTTGRTEGQAQGALPAEEVCKMLNMAMVAFGQPRPLERSFWTPGSDPIDEKVIAQAGGGDRLERKLSRAGDGRREGLVIWAPLRPGSPSFEAGLSQDRLKTAAMSKKRRNSGRNKHGRGAMDCMAPAGRPSALRPRC